MTRRVAAASWPPTDEERGAAKMRDGAFLLLLRARLLRKRAEGVDAELAHSRRQK